MEYERDESTFSEEESSEIARLWWESFIPKQFATMLNFPEFKKAVDVVNKIRGTVDEALEEYDAVAKYDVKFDPILGTNMLFTVTVPSIGFTLTNKKIDEINSTMPTKYLINVYTLKDGSLEIGFTFYNVQHLIS